MSRAGISNRTTWFAIAIPPPRELKAVVAAIGFPVVDARLKDRVGDAARVGIARHPRLLGRLAKTFAHDTDRGGRTHGPADIPSTWAANGPRPISSASSASSRRMRASSSLSERRSVVKRTSLTRGRILLGEGLRVVLEGVLRGKEDAPALAARE